MASWCQRAREYPEKLTVEPRSEKGISTLTHGGCCDTGPRGRPEKDAEAWREKGSRPC
jgi:hypothetical protein